MAKKILCVIVLMIALVCVLASCGHEHEWSEWQTIKEATCTIDGLSERVCECGEKETQVITAGHNFVAANCTTPKKCTKCAYTEGSALGHSFEYGACTRLGCVENLGAKLDVTVLPTELPLTIHSGSVTGRLKITELGWGYKFNKNNTFTLYLYHGGEKVQDGNTNFTAISFHITDENGYTIEKDSFSVGRYTKGDKYPPQYDAIAYNLDPNGKYTIEVKGFD